MENAGASLISAARTNDFRAVQACLAGGAGVDATDADASTALMHAAACGHYKIANFLLLCGADARRLNAKGETALLLARRNARREIAELLEAELDRHTQEKDAADLAKLLDHLLVTAIEEGSLKEVREHANAESINRKSPEDGATPLHVAARRGRSDVVELLVERGARVDEVDATGRTPLHVACQSGDSASVRYLVTRAAANVQVVDQTARTALHYSSEKGDMSSVRVLLSGRAALDGVDENRLSPIDLAVSGGHLDVVRELNRNGASLKNISEDGRSILHRAVLSENAELIEFLVNQNVEVNKVDTNGWTPLELALSRGQVELCEKLLDLGATLSKQAQPHTDEQSKKRIQSMLELVVDGDHDELLSLILSLEGVDVNVRNDSGRTGLISAAAKGRHATVLQLLQAGAEVDARGDAGETALIMATLGGFAKAVHVLLEHGARTDITSNSGKTALTVAKSKELKDLLQLYHNSQQFHDQCFKLINDPNPEARPSITELKELVPLITSVYDLRLMLTLVAMNNNKSDESDQSPDARRQLVKESFTLVVTKKLTYDDEACVFFKMALEHCEREGLLPRNEVLLLDRQAEKVNTESADWVLEMKKQVYVNSWRLDKHEQHLHAVVTGLREVYGTVMENRKVLSTVSRRVGGLQKQIHESKKLIGRLSKSVSHVAKDVSRFESRLSQSEANIEKVASNLKNFRETYVERLRQEERNQKIKRVCGIVASVAGFVFAPVLKEVAGAVVDFANPIDIVEAVYGEHDIARFVSEGSEKALPKVIQEQLEKYAIPQDEFETLLREEIVLQHPEYVSECEKRGLSVSVDGGQSDVARSVEPVLETEEVALLKLVSELQGALSDAVSSSMASGNTKEASSAAASAPPRLNVTTPASSRAGGGDVFVSASPPRSPSARPSSHVPSSPPRSPSARQASTPHSRPAPQSAVPGNFATAEEVVSPATTPQPAAEAASSRASGVSEVTGSDSTDGVVFVDDLESFHYHMAVHECRGELSDFVELVEMIDGDVGSTMKMELRSESRKREALCAAAYAYRLGFDQVGDLLASRMKNPPPTDKTAATSVELLQDVEEFPFFCAVDESGGDVDEFSHFLELVDDADHSLDMTIEADVVLGSTQPVEWSAVEYACHLGYVDVVKFLLKDVVKDAIPMKTKFQLLKSVREQSARLGATRNSILSA